MLRAVDTKKGLVRDSKMTFVFKNTYYLIKAKAKEAIARNIWLLAASHDIRLQFEHIPGEQNCVADLLSRWQGIHNPLSKLYKYLNNQPVWVEVDRNYLALNWNI
jgi:hypothetical protein